ncbi:acyl-CoA reductase [Pedobacter sp. HMF7647]|uniref:Acyl-CoA reductase n=1 Tax=Hufsiella arboris TaxID=2695275 RepID=A0A7K1YDY4_9SPHI|nr:acyl-CoA reductase [Hufsiella arboris]MXV52571.1 acyl-CoA reductase [Hufsiella arboris]
MTLTQRIKAFTELGSLISNPDENLTATISQAKNANAWFTFESTLNSVKNIGQMLNNEDLTKWLTPYDNSSITPKTVGLVLAGNIPMVGFYDILCVLAAGHKALIKLSSHDQQLIPFVLNELIKIEPGFNDQISYTERLQQFDAVIATGSNNTSRYFEHYFAKYPHIIRKNRNSVAVLTGNESAEELGRIGHDIFDYFGLGCRNVSKLFVPENYKFDFFFESIEHLQPVINHHKYCNNYDYNKSIFLVNSELHLDNGFLLVKEDERLSSPLAVVYFEYYSSIAGAQDRINFLANDIQVVVSAAGLNITPQLVKPGESQHPKLWDYADGINTLEFLSSLN